MEPERPDTLERFVDESLKQCVAHGYYPSVFLDMRENLGVREAIRRLVESSEVQSGFKKLQELGLLDWSLEAAVIHFPEGFSVLTRECAGFRLGQLKGRKLKERKDD